MTWWRGAVAAVVVLASAVGVAACSPASSNEPSGLPETGGLTEYLARTLDNSSRVWLQEDSFAGVLGEASSLNRYAFVQGSPVTFVDVWGFFRSAADVDAFMAVNDPNKGKPISHVIRDWAEDHPGTVTGMVTGFAFGAVCTLATAGAGLLACAAMGGALSNAIGSSIDYGMSTPASERSVDGFLGAVVPAIVTGAVLGVAGEGFGVVLQGAAKPLLTNASRALTNAFTDAAASGVDDVARVTWRSTWDDVVDGVSTTWNAKVPFKPRTTADAPTTTGPGPAARSADAAGMRAPTVGDLRASGASDAHHIIQDAAVRDLPGYQTNAAPGVQLSGPSTLVGSEHYAATVVQRAAGGGSYAAERQIAFDALRAAGFSEADAAAAVARADLYFVDQLGVTLDTVTRIPRNRAGR